MKTTTLNLYGSLLIISLVFSGCKDQTEQKEAPINSTKIEASNETLTKADEAAKIESSKVCYVNNKFMGIDQIPVVVEGKTYYGCCPDCVGKIKTLREVRYSKDPFTGKEVDKASAFIVLSPAGNNDVLYFESEQSYRNFFKI